MKNISKVYRNMSTVIPKDIVKRKNINNQTFVKWIINNKTNEIFLKTLFEGDINPDCLITLLKQIII